MQASLKQFYRDYLEWVNSGAITNVEHNKHAFTRHCGLCVSLISWCYMRDLSSLDLQMLKHEMKKQFIDASLNPAYPFGGVNLYKSETLSGMCHLNEKRINWVKNHAS